MQILETKKKKKTSFILFTALATSLMASSLLTTSPASAQTIETNESTITNESIERVSNIAMNAAISEHGNTWRQPGGFNYFRAYITNTGTETIKVYVSEDGYSTLVGSIAPNKAMTWGNPTPLVLPANGKSFTLSYTSPSGKLSGTATVRVSDTPLS